MTSLATCLSPRLAGETPARMAGLVHRMEAAALRALATHRTIAQLRSLDDHMLMDIGLHRGEIESIALGLGFDQTRHHR